MEPYLDRIGQRLDDPASVPPKYRHLIADDQQRVMRILEFPVSGRVLDVGCSDGAITRRIAKAWGVQIEGIDLNAPGEFSGGDVKFLNCDIAKPWTRPGYPALKAWKRIHRAPFYDAVYACELFEHLTDADADIALRNIRAVLKPGGDLIVTVPNRHPDDLYEVGCRSRWAWPDHRSVWASWKLSLWLLRHFTDFEPVPLYDGEPWERSIFLIVRARGRR